MINPEENKAIEAPKRPQLSVRLTRAEHNFIERRKRSFRTKKGYVRHLLVTDGYDIKNNDVKQKD